MDDHRRVLGRLPRGDREDCRRGVAIYVDAAGQRRLHVAGFSWQAALVQPLWAWHRRLHGIAILMLASMWSMHVLVASGIDNIILQALAGLAWFVAQAWVVGRHANEWHRRALLRAGFRAVAGEATPHG